MRGASATPMARMLIDEDGREITYVEYRAECERVAAGFQELGVGVGTAVSWQLPTWIESVVLVGALSRLGAVQNPILPIYREREVGFVAKQTGAKLLIVPGEWRGFDYEAMALSIAKDTPDLEVLVVEPGAAAGRHRQAAVVRGRSRCTPVGVLHVGHDRGSQGREAH